MFEIKSRKTIALLTTGVLLMVLSVAMPTAYADTLLDPHVVGSGTGTYGALACPGKTGSATIAFDGSGSINGGHGTWSITVSPSTGGTFTVSGTINTVSATPPNNPRDAMLTGVETIPACGASGTNVAFSTTCNGAVGTGLDDIAFSSTSLPTATQETFLGSGPVKCKG